MTSLKLLLVLGALGAAGCAAPRALPADVVAFKEARDGCDHFRGEEPYDAARAAFIAAQLEKLCTGTDQRLVELQARYRNRPDVTAALAGYEHPVE